MAGAGEIQSEAGMLRRILDSVEAPTAAERVRTGPGIVGRVCAGDVASPRSLPAADTATMDGYALRRSDAPGALPVAGEAWAGAPFEGEAAPGTCVRIATGAWVPAGLDLVVPREEAQAGGDKVTFGRPGDSNIRLRGEELAEGEALVEAGSVLTPRSLALLAGLGIDRVAVRPRPTVGVISTGDEIRDPGESLPPGASHDANRPMVLSLLGRSGFAALDLGIARDDERSLREALGQAQESCDAAVTIGGASVGERDLVKKVLADMGEMTAWKVAIKPGKPLVLGRIGKVPLFGLPGNPSSAFVTFSLLVLPGLWKLAGVDPLPVLHSFRARLSAGLGKRPGRAEYFRAALTCDPELGWVATPFPMQGSGALSVLARADCLLRLPEGSEGAAEGEEVDVYPLEALP